MVGYGMTETSAKVNILLAPVFVKNLEQAVASLNDDFNWSFELKSRPDAELKLFKDNKELKLSDRILIKKEENLDFV